MRVGAWSLVHGLVAAMVATCAWGQGCDNKIVGDGAAWGIMRTGLPRAYKSIAVPSRGLEWFKRQTEKRASCSDRLVVFIGTNDVGALTTDEEASMYAVEVIRTILVWYAKTAVWVLPGCFDENRRPEMERGSQLLDRAVEKLGVVQGVGFFRTRKVFCVAPQGDGIHHTREDYASMWEAIEYAMGTR